MGRYRFNLGNQPTNRRNGSVYRWNRRLDHQHDVLVELGWIWKPPVNHARITKRKRRSMNADAVRSVSLCAFVRLDRLDRR